MKKYSKTIGIYVVILILGILLGKWFFTSTTSANDTENNAHQHSHEGAEEVWTCSMHPEIREDQPGDCPICGMDLVQLDSDESGLDPKAIKMSEQARQLAKVATAFPSDSPDESSSLTLDGKLMFNQTYNQKLTAEFHGRIDVLNIDYEGQEVTKGQVIAELYSPELESLQRELLIAAKQKDENSRLFEASVRKLKNWNINETEINQIINTGEVQGRTKIRSQYNGIVSNLNVRQGNHIERGDVLFEVNDITHLWAEFEAYEKDAGNIRKGDLVRISTRALPNTTWESKIVFVSPILNNQRRSFQVRAEINNTDLKLKPSFIVQGEIQQKATEDSGLWLPKSAVLWTGKRSVVYQEIEENGQVGFIMHEVETGSTSGEYILITKGIESDQTYAVNGVFSIDAAAQISAKPSMMNRRGQKSKSQQIAWEEVQLENENLQAIIQLYLELKEALADDEEEKSIQIAEEFYQQVEKMNFSNLEVKQNFKQLIKDVEKSKNIEVARQHFQYLSDVLITLAKQENPLDETLYIQFCPMVDNDQGAFWLSTEKEIKNPYFGSMMLKCGSLEQEL